MKWLKLLIVAIVLTASYGVCQEIYMEQATLVSSDTGDIQAYTPTSNAGGFFYGLLIHTDGTNAITELNVYDNTAGSGTTLIEDAVITTSAANRMYAISFEPPLPFNTGIYITATCSGEYTIQSYVRSR